MRMKTTPHRVTVMTRSLNGSRHHWRQVSRDQAVCIATGEPALRGEPGKRVLVEAQVGGGKCLKDTVYPLQRMMAQVCQRVMATVLFS